ncbi:MAG: L-2-amino-thiazoline-4-carboxylic acid hydrolase [bacterium]|nr:MAG: L-2-amino-thiazoline-4-carboxylic acid hydrolase [bacterium]
MKHLDSVNPSRRQFITKILPACSMICMGGGFAFAHASNKNDPFFQDDEKHKFDSKMDKILTYRQYMKLRYGEFIQIVKAFASEFGKDKVSDFLNKNTSEKMLKYGQSQAKKSTDNNFQTYVGMFRNNPYFDKTLTMEIVEDTEKAFEIKVTECVWATTFLQADAGEFGYAAVCYGDYAWAEGFNPKIKMVRDKTLMQGDEYCNHRYIWQA